MSTLRKRIVQVFVLLIFLLIMMFISVPTTFASSPSPTTATTTAAFMLKSGSLTIIVGNPSPPTVIPAGQSWQEIRYSLPVTITDATGTGNGWDLTAQTSGDNSLQASDAFFIKGLTFACAANSTCANPRSTIAPAGPISITASPVTVLQANPGTGMGQFNVMVVLSIMTPVNASFNSASIPLSFTLSSGTELL